MIRLKQEGAKKARVILGALSRWSRARVRSCLGFAVEVSKLPDANLIAATVAALLLQAPFAVGQR
jgi:hypothetical protein